MSNYQSSLIHIMESHKTESTIDLINAMHERHSVRKYTSKTIEPNILSKLNAKIEECNKKGNLHIQLVKNEKKAFKGLLAYGKFYGVENYIVMIGKDSKDLDEKIGYYGEQIVLTTQTLGLSTCWVGLTYKKVSEAYTINNGEKLVCVISIGYAQGNGKQHKSKTASQISNADNTTPSWFIKGVEAALLAPTAINQQKFSFKYDGVTSDGRHKVIADKGFSLVGYTHIDLGIAKYHFEIAAGKENFIWE